MTYVCMYVRLTDLHPCDVINDRASTFTVQYHQTMFAASASILNWVELTDDVLNLVVFSDDVNTVGVGMWGGFTPDTRAVESDVALRSPIDFQNNMSTQMDVELST